MARFSDKDLDNATYVDNDFLQSWMSSINFFVPLSTLQSRFID